MLLFHGAIIFMYFFFQILILITYVVYTATKTNYLFVKVTLMGL